jgi:hypothetical protein
MSNHKTIIVDWYGAYSPEHVEENKDWENGLYLASGYLKHKQSEDVHYCGITEGSFSARHAKHHKLSEITRNRKIWIGEIAYPNRPKRDILELAESVIIYFWQPELNTRKTVNPPSPVTLINRWHKPDETPRLRQHPMCKDIEDVISWDGELWRTGNLTVWED